VSLTAVLFLLAFLVGISLAIVRHPIYGLLTYVGVFYVHPPSRWWGQGMLADIRWSLIAAGVTILAILVRRSKFHTASVTRSGAFWGIVAFLLWLCVQSFWALDVDAHIDLISIYLKFVLVIVMICKCVESAEHLRMFLWAHVLGCAYLGWLAFTTYAGGRLDGIGGPGINEANAAALQFVTGIIVAGSLFLGGSLKARGTVVAVIPFVVNALVSTISRGGFLAAGIGGVIFNLFTPPKHRSVVRIMSILALLLFALLTNDMYWQRISTIKYKGEQVEGVDTGGGRLEILDAQWRMFRTHPLGCGHMCTTALSPSYLDARFLSGGIARASHNTFMTMLVDHGLVGGAFYVALLAWIFRSIRTVFGRIRRSDGFIATAVPAVAAVFAAITVGDMFAQYPKFEARIWFMSLVIVLLHLSKDTSASSPGNPVDTQPQGTSI